MPSRTRNILTVVAFLAILAGVVVPSLIAIKQVGALSDCVANYSQQFSAAYQARLASSSTPQLDDVLKAADQKDTAAFNKALDQYLAARDQQIAEQQRNPYPPLPDTFCGGDR